MSKQYYKLLWGIFAAALALGTAMRTPLKLFFTDIETGFYFLPTHWLVPVFTVLLVVAALALPLLNALHRGDNDYPVEGGGPILPLWGILAGVALIIYVLWGLPNPLGQDNPAANMKTVATIRMINYVLGALAGLSFILTGLLGLLRKHVPSLPLLLPAIWQVVLLFGRFSGYHSILYIVDFQLAILFMVFSTLFYLGHARTISGTGRTDGRNYVMSSGLCMALCGLLLVVPNVIYMLVRGSSMPVMLLSMLECIFVAVMSVYGLLFVARYTNSMKTV